MRHLLCLAFAVLLGAAAPCAASAQDTRPAANPILTPTALLALRGAPTTSTQLRLVFERERDGRADKPLEVWIGPDYFAVVTEDGESLYDLRLRRRLGIDTRTRSLVNGSLYSDIIFRQIELTRRTEIAKLTTKQGGDEPLPQSLEPFWLESDLGLRRPGQSAPDLDRRTGDDGVTRFRHGAQVVASFAPGAQPIPAAVRHGYRAFLHYRLPLHPSIAAALGDADTVPARLDFTSEARGQPEKIALRLKEATVAEADYPLPPGLTSKVLPAGDQDPDVALFRRVVPMAVDAIAGRAGNGPRSIAAYRNAIGAALQRGEKFEATLLLSELALQWGRGATSCDNVSAPSPCQGKDEINAAMAGDRNVGMLFEGIAIQTTEPERAIALWRRLDRGGVPDGFVVDIFLARLLSARGQREEAAKSFAAAFAGNPYIAALYRDLGDYYAQGSRTDLAWLSYDLGRALPGRTTPDALSSIDQLEQELAKQYPDFF